MNTLGQIAELVVTSQPFSLLVWLAQNSCRAYFPFPVAVFFLVGWL